MVEGGRRWNKDLIQLTFNAQDAASILQIPISQLGLKDKLVWQHTCNCSFSVNSACGWLAAQETYISHQSESSTSAARVQSCGRKHGR